ncbi:baseplate tail tube cap [Cyanophage S-RIM14]|uniref:Baseplate tail tube cap n=1 Tax=Cyanophage S-RIM14 TaxID=1278423 RepID=A0A1D7SKP9_9CAUD|nr:baseplate tail tube cap [Cyanophage S-RIM14]
MANLIYPVGVPVPGDFDDYHEDGPTGAVDYLRIRRFRDKKATNAKNKGFFYNRAGGYQGGRKNNGTICFLACPPDIKTNYITKYSEVKFGAVGMAAGGLLADGSALTTESATATLQEMAGGLVPSTTLDAIAKITSGLGNQVGSSSGATASDLLAVSQGKIFNPYEENIFQGMAFRSHTFSFKMVARSEAESAIIGQIVSYLKAGSLASFNPQDETSGGGSALLGETDIEGRYLHVPDKFELSFRRLLSNGSELSEIPHYKFAPCVLESVAVSYTPDGQYVALKHADNEVNKLHVPAIAINLNFKEVQYITKEMALQGF